MLNKSALLIPLFISSAIAQENVILFGDVFEPPSGFEEFDLSFQYDPATNALSNVYSDQNYNCASSAAESVLINSAALQSNNLTVVGQVDWLGCDEAVDFIGTVQLDAPLLSIGDVQAADPVIVSEPPTWLLLVKGFIVAIYFRWVIARRAR